MRLPHGNCYWVEPGRLMAGEYPGAALEFDARVRLQAHLDCGLDYFLDLTEEVDGLTPYGEWLRDLAPGAIHRQLGIRDMDIPSVERMRAILSDLATALAAGRNVYVHCWGGIGRTGSVVGCHLVQGGKTGEEALAQIAQWWQTVAKRMRAPRSPQTDQQIEYVRSWR